MVNVQCPCGDIEMHLSGEPVVQLYRHGDDGQRMHGAASVPSAVCRADDVQSVRGEPRASRLRSSRRRRVALARFAMPLEAVLAGALLSGCVEIIDGNRVLAEEARPEQDFTRVHSRGVLDVALAEGPFAVTVRIDENLVPHVRTAVSDDTLFISVEGGNIRKYLPGPHVLVTLPLLRDAELTGSGSLVATELGADTDVSLELTGSGRLSWSGRAEALDALVAGSGELSLDGTAETAELLLRGSGALDARGLTARGANIEVDGSGNITATVDGRVDARASGSGSIELFGEVSEGVWEEVGDSTITGP